MNDLSEKERLSRAFDGKPVDRKPVICPGGMMNAAIVDVMTETGHVLPDAHSDDLLMSLLAEDIRRLTGFENLGVPFCMTIEPGALGSEVDLGSLSCEPKIRAEAFGSVREVEYRDIPAALRGGRVETLWNAAARLSGKDGDVPVIGSISGPVSTAASIVDPMVFLKELRKDGANAHRVMSYVTDFLIEYAKGLLESGVYAVSIADPTATGEILGPRLFDEYAVHYINRVVDAIHDAGGRAIVHICGNMGSVWRLIPSFRADAISADAMVSLKKLKADFPQIVTMGNLSTYTLEFASPSAVAEKAAGIAGGSIDIAAPACGLSTSSSIENLRAFTGTVKDAGPFGAAG
ncbi:MAG: methylcobamide--CoM methyltransferase [Clostridiales Family XIII bacterium]|jgi:[methyl-Co(III) methanol-specific corrinoid protein]:coenzyme M methyltransferase|nr:methylcobamide--CoM methyltransferase [Clostridiales Family XIII bacterium]